MIDERLNLQEVIVIGGFEVLFSLAGSLNLFLNCSLWTSPQ
jgi:hypothetical protein